MSSASAPSSAAAGSRSSGHKAASSSSVAPALGPDVDVVNGIAPAPRSDPSFIVAIDFGTARSSYAYALTSSLRDNERPISHIECGAFAGATSGQKTKTAVLLDAASLECVAFGDEAVQQYCNAEQEDLDSYYYFERFKMALYDQQGASKLTKETKIKSADGREVSAISVFSAALTFLSKEAMAHLTGMALGLSEDDVRWVLTVPAIWSEAAKQIMLEAARLARMNRVVLALEPEAASVLSRHEREAMTKVAYPVGTVYMVLDCGGGTVDVTVHETLTETKPGEKDKPAQVKEVYKASGDAFGSTYINAAFEQVLDDVFGADHMSSYCEEWPADWLTMLNKFESIKLLTKAEVKKEKKRVELPKSFIKFITEKHGGEDADVDTLIDNYLQAHAEQINTLFDSYSLNKDAPLGYDDNSGSLVLSQAFMHSLILPVVDKVIAHAQSVLADPKSGSITNIFLVGGFADCPLLHKRVVASLERKGDDNKADRIVIKPALAGLAVMKGAVLYGLHPVITHRIMRYTYGVQCNDVWSDDKYGPAEAHRKHRGEKGVWRCRNVLLPFVRVGDTVQSGVPKLHAFVPCDRGHIMEVRIHRSLKRDARFTEECELCAKITIRLPPANADNSNDRGVTVRMFFGEEKIRVELEVNATKEIKEEVIDFLA